MVKLIDDEKLFALQASDERLQWEYCERCGKKMVSDLIVSYFHRTDGRKIYEVRKRCPKYSWAIEFAYCFLDVLSFFFRGYTLNHHSVTEWLIIDPAMKEET